MKQTFNVLCVTKRSSDDRQISWHTPETGEAELTVDLDGLKNGEPLIKVRFKCYDYQFNHNRSGLNGTCVVIGINKSRWEIWELYTDTPIDKGEYTSSPEKIREIARQEIESHARNRW